MSNTASGVTPSTKRASTSNDQPHRKVRLPRVLAPVAMALATVVVVAGVALGGAETVSAQETVAKAAQTLGGVTSGKIGVTVESFDPERPSPDLTSSARYVFSDGSFDVSFGEDGAPWGEGSGRIIRVGDTDYTSLGFVTESDEFIESRAGEFIDDIDYESILSLDDVNALNQDRLLPIINAATDLEEVAEEDGEVTYRGTVPADLLEGLDRESLPAGFAALLTSASYQPGLAPPEYGPAGYVKPDDLGDTVTFEVDVANGTIASVVLEIPDYRITIDYTELGQPQSVSAPSNIITMDELEQRFNDLEGS